MRRAGGPIWLAAPTRFAGIGRGRARIVLALFALLLLACLTAIDSPGPRPTQIPGSPAAAAIPPGQTDLLLYQTIVENVRNGEPYYQAAADAQRIGHYPLRPFIAFRLPTLAVVEAALPPPVVNALLLLLCVGTIVAWTTRLRANLVGILPVGVAGLSVLVGLYVNLEPALVVFHEIWAGALIALSLALWRPGRWVAPVAIGLCAVLIRETALLYVGVMLVAAWIEGDRRESMGWAGAVAIFGVVLAAHAHAVSLVTGPLDIVSQGWTGLQGFGFYVKLVTISSGLDILPQWAASLLLGTAMFGWVAWRSPLATRAVAMFAGYSAVIALLARSDNFYWALITTPGLLVGLVFAVDGLRDAFAAALDTRRITVTRVVR